MERSMSSLAELPNLVGFFSYSREDDEDSKGKLSALRDAIGRDLATLLGRSRQRDFRLWQDREAIATGDRWESEIAKAIDEAAFFIPIITPRAVASKYCQLEFDSFLTRERALGRDDLVFPVLYVNVPALADEARWRAHPVLSIVGERQYFDWRRFRYLAPETPVYDEEIGRFCEQIAAKLSEPMISAEERRLEEAEAMRRAEEESARLIVQARKQAEERQRLETEARERAEYERHLRAAPKPPPVVARANDERPSTRDVFIYVSYAHDDDLTMSASPDEAGFVTFLIRMLEVRLRDLGAARARIWFDRLRIHDGDQYDRPINDALRKADLLLVVMSPNWIQRPYCRKELEAFVEYCRGRGITDAEERLIMVGKGYVNRGRRPPELYGQQGFLFYGRDNEEDAADVTPFFKRGKATDDRFYDVGDQLAAQLARRVERIAESGAGPSRTVYLAKPAADMKRAYARVAPELQSRGFVVVPDAAVDLPGDAGALSVIDAALAQAKLSVHLVGDSVGFAPEGLEPIVKLQLARARERTTQGPTFHRLVWAPRVVDPEAVRTADRDPVEVLARFDRYVEGDKIDGDPLPRFHANLSEWLV